MLPCLWSTSCDQDPTSSPSPPPPRGGDGNGKSPSPPPPLTPSGGGTECCYPSEGSPYDAATCATIGQQGGAEKCESELNGMLPCLWSVSCEEQSSPPSPATTTGRCCQLGANATTATQATCDLIYNIPQSQWATRCHGFGMTNDGPQCFWMGNADGECDAVSPEPEPPADDDCGCCTLNPGATQATAEGCAAIMNLPTATRPGRCEEYYGGECSWNGQADGTCDLSDCASPPPRPDENGDAKPSSPPPRAVDFLQPPSPPPPRGPRPIKVKAIVRLAGISAVDFDEGAFAAAMSVILNLPAAKISVIAYSSVTISRHLAAEAVEVQFEVEIDGDTDTVADAIVQMLESDNLGASFAAEFSMQIAEGNPGAAVPQITATIVGKVETETEESQDDSDDLPLPLWQLAAIGGAAVVALAGVVACVVMRGGGAQRRASHEKLLSPADIAAESEAPMSSMAINPTYSANPIATGRRRVSTLNPLLAAGMPGLPGHAARNSTVWADASEQHGNFDTIFGYGGNADTAMNMNGGAARWTSLSE